MNSWNPYNALNLQKLEATELFQGAHRKLRENRWYKPVLDFAEEATKVNRVYLVSGIGSLFSLILLFEFGTCLISGCVGFLYPCYKTLEVLEKEDLNVGRKWLLYWFLLSALSFLEIFFFFLYWVPGYWIIKCLLLFWCYAPLQRNGADVIYSYLIQPFFQKNQEAIDNAINQVTRTAYSIYTELDPQAESTTGHDHEN